VVIIVSLVSGERKTDEGCDVEIAGGASLLSKMDL